MTRRMSLSYVFEGEEKELKTIARVLAWYLKLTICPVYEAKLTYAHTTFVSVKEEKGDPTL